MGLLLLLLLLLLMLVDGVLRSCKGEMNDDIKERDTETKKQPSLGSLTDIHSKHYRCIDRAGSRSSKDPEIKPQRFVCLNEREETMWTGKGTEAEV